MWNYEHPISTFKTPRYYCIPKLDVFKIYRHYKDIGYFTSTHVYQKKYTIKVVKISDYIYPSDIDSEIKYRGVLDRICDNTTNSIEALLKGIRGEPISKLNIVELPEPLIFDIPEQPKNEFDNPLI